MRDLQRLEQLSSTAALGMWADDVVLALGRALAGAVSDDDRQFLERAAGVFEAALSPTTLPTPPAKSARDLAATNTALSALASLANLQLGDQTEILDAMAKTMRAAATGELGPSDADRVKPLIALFELMSERQLVESNSVLMSRKDTEAWTAIQRTLSFS